MPKKTWDCKDVKIVNIPNWLIRTNLFEDYYLFIMYFNPIVQAENVDQHDLISSKPCTIQDQPTCEVWFKWQYYTMFTLVPGERTFT